MKKFNLNSLEKTFDKINNIQKNIAKDENNIITKTYKKCNNKSIETILSVLLMCFEEDYKLASEEYYKKINYFSDNYLIGSEWYIGLEYSREYYFNNLDKNIQYKYLGIIYFLSSIYHK